MTGFNASVRKAFAVWLWLLALLGLTIAAALLPLGLANPVVALFVACMKAGLVMGFFMELHRSAPLFKLITATALAALGILIALSSIDYVTRHTEKTPWQKVPAPLVGPDTSYEHTHSQHAPVRFHTSFWVATFLLPYEARPHAGPGYPSASILLDNVRLHSSPSEG